MRAKLLFGSSRRQKTYRGRTRMQPFQTSLQKEERAFTGPTCEGGLLPGLGAKVRCRRTMRNRIRWRGQPAIGWLLYIGDSLQPLLRHLSRFHSCQAGHNSLLLFFFLTQNRIPEPKRMRMILCPWFPNCVPRCHRAPQPTQRGPLRYFKCFEGNLTSSGRCAN